MSRSRGFSEGANACHCGASGSSGDGEKRARRSRALPLVCGLLLLAVGLMVMLYPVISDISARTDANDAIATMRERAISDSASTVEGADGKTYRAKEHDAAYEQLVAYNQAVLNGTGDAVNDPFAFEAEQLDSFDLPDGIMGSISIPAMGIQIPLYLGATSEHLAHGAGIIAGTSLPLGEETSNTVIAAHRGQWYGLNMFRDIEKLSQGDQVIIETPWDTLVYRVTSFEIIAPDEVDALGIEEGRDIVTLFTCHPYGHNYQRILVHCDRDLSAEPQEAPSPVSGALQTLLPTSWSEESPLLNVENVLRLVGAVLFAACVALLLFRTARGVVRGRSRTEASVADGGGRIFTEAGAVDGWKNAERAPAGGWRDAAGPPEGTDTRETGDDGRHHAAGRWKQAGGLSRDAPDGRPRNRSDGRHFKR